MINANYGSGLGSILFDTLVYRKVDNICESGHCLYMNLAT